MGGISSLTGCGRTSNEDFRIWNVRDPDKSLSRAGRSQKAFNVHWSLVPFWMLVMGLETAVGRPSSWVPWPLWVPISCGYEATLGKAVRGATMCSQDVQSTGMDRKSLTLLQGAETAEPPWNGMRKWRPGLSWEWMRVGISSLRGEGWEDGILGPVPSYFIMFLISYLCKS